MKRILFISGLLLVFFIGCKKDQDDLATFSEDDASEIIASSLSEDAGGLSDNLYYAAKLSEEIYEENLKEDIFDTTFVLESEGLTRIEFLYTLSFSYGIRYNSQNQNFEFYADFDTEGSYTTERISSSDSSEGDLVISGLESSEEDYVISANCIRSGNQKMSFADSQSVSSTIKFELNDLTMRKSDYFIESGNGNVEIYGKTEDGSEFAFTGSLEYNDGTVILIINGIEYIIDLETGSIG